MRAVTRWGGSALKGRAPREDVVDQIAMRIEDRQTVTLYQVLLNH